MADTPKLTADMLADLEAPHDARISPSGSQVVYTLRADWNRPKGRWVSSLWLADVGKHHSARQITSGTSHDMSPQWSPHGDAIAFLSDRAKEGVFAVWTLEIKEGAEPKTLSPTDLEQGVSKFAWSGDGQWIAYLSADEKSAERRAKDEKKDDVKVYGEHWDYARLRVINVATPTEHKTVSEDRHIYDLAWSPDSRSIAFATMLTPEYEIQMLAGSKLQVFNMVSMSVAELVHIDGMVQDLSWVTGALWFRAPYTMNAVKSSMVVYTVPLDTKLVERYGYGKDTCASPWGFPPGMVQLSSEKLAVQVLSGLRDELHILPEGRIIYDELQETRSWHVALVKDQTIMAVVTSSPSRPFEVYSIVDGETICLSDHGSSIAKLEVAIAKPFYATAQDGTKLDAIHVTPKTSDISKPLPTIVLVHGGPYGRSSVSFDMPNFNWSAWFASLGYAMLLPNYRGGSGHGEKFAAGVRGKAGILDYSDTIDIVKAAVEAKIVDPEKVAIAGWSYGGYMSYLAVARDSTFHFQAAMCGAGLSDWDHTIMTSIGWRSAIEIAGTGPWIGGVNNVINRENSAIWQMKGATTPVLILHGEDDDIVPISQALGFHHGCEYYKIPCEMAIYPREGHGIFPPFERAHYIDHLERMKRFFDRYLRKEVET